MQLMKWLMCKPSEPSILVGNRVKCFQLFMINIWKKWFLELELKGWLRSMNLLMTIPHNNGVFHTTNLTPWSLTFYIWASFLQCYLDYTNYWTHWYRTFILCYYFSLLLRNWLGCPFLSGIRQVHLYVDLKE